VTEALGPRPRLVCFDLGGVLVRIHHTWDDARRGAGVPILAESPGEEAARRALTVKLGTGRITVDAWADGVSQALCGAYAPADLVRVHHAICLVEYPGTPALVQAIHDAGIPTACLSNTDHAHWARLAHRDDRGPLAGTPEYPSVARLQRHFASHLLGIQKPDAGAYEAVERETGVSGADVVFFDDRPENVEAAARRRWRAYRVGPEGDPPGAVRARLARYLEGR
jgi:FMN phosphatase YigB (HAD superfamily)